MISIDVLFERVPGLDPRDIERWILNAWVRPDGQAGHYEFREIDVARVRLILELRDEMQVNEDALPIVLLLLDQLHDGRRRLREVGDALTLLAPDEVRLRILGHLASLTGWSSASSNTPSGSDA